MVVVGGLGSIPGAVIGALLMIILPEVLRQIGDVRMIVVGVGHVLMYPDPAQGVVRGNQRA